MKLRITSCVLLLVMMLLSAAGSLTAFAEDAEDSAEETSRPILSEAVDAYSSLSIFGEGGAPGHGNNQTRLLRTDSGLYMTCPGKTPEGESKNVGTMGMWKINDDGTSRMLIEYPVQYIGAGTTSQVMADGEGNVWTVSSWNEGSGFYRLHAWKYDPKAETNQVKHFEARGYYRKGGNYGKPIAIMDVKFNRIYVVTCGEAATSNYMMWTLFDMGALEWDTDMKVVKVEACGYYHYGYADGKGGFYTIAEYCPTIFKSRTDLEGMNVETAVKTFRSRKTSDNYVWLEPFMYYVPNADVSAKEASGFDVPVERAVFDVRNGCYPTMCNDNGDLFLDEATGYLYVVVTMDDSGQFGRRTDLYVYDTNTVNENIEEEGVFPLIAREELTFGLGKGASYVQHYYKDTEGNLYLVAVSTEMGVVEIWMAKDHTLATEFTLVYASAFTGAIDLKSGTGTTGTVIATNRNNSQMTDVAYMASFVRKTGIWYNYAVDFAALRMYLENQ